jgi:DNA-binding transcriptional MocR family regulator
VTTVRHDLGHFALVPEWLTTSVSPSAIKMWTRLWIYTGNGTHDAWPSQALLAQELQCSARTVQRILDELEAAGALSVRNRHGTSSVYTLHWYPSYPHDKNGQGTYDTGVVTPTTPVSYKERLSEIEKHQPAKYDTFVARRTEGDAPLTREQIRHLTGRKPRP